MFDILHIITLQGIVFFLDDESTENILHLIM